MSINKSNKKESVSSLYTLLTAGELVMLDKNYRNNSMIEVVSQTSRRLFTRVKTPNGYEWDVMTNRLTVCKIETEKCNKK